MVLRFDTARLAAYCWLGGMAATAGALAGVSDVLYGGLALAAVGVHLYIRLFRGGRQTVVSFPQVR